jgi:hypothetical protein
LELVLVGATLLDRNLALRTMLAVQLNFGCRLGLWFTDVVELWVTQAFVPGLDSPTVPARF